MKTVERTYEVKIKCLKCKTEHPILVNKEDWDLYNSPSRPHIQDIFPYLSPDEREMFISGICDKCWKELFGGDDDE